MSENVSSGRSVGAGQGWTWIADGFGLFKKAPGTWIALVIILFVILLVLAFIPWLGAIATFLLMPLFVGGLILGCRALQGGGELELSHLFAGFKTHTANLVVLGALAIGGWIIVMLPVVALVGAGAFFGAMRGDAAGMAAMGGSFLLAWLVAMALSIPIYMALWFAPALVVLRGLAPVAALKESFLGCLKNVGPFLIYSIVLLVFSVFATLPFLLGWLVLGPVAIASVYVSYRDIYGDA
jgi:hypothetical protein